MEQLLPIYLEDGMYLIKTTKEDIDLILKMDKQELTQKYLGGVKNRTYEERLDFLTKKENKFKDKNYSLTLVLPDNTKIGFFTLKVNEQTSSAEISYILDLDYTKKGYCKKTIQKLIDVSFNELNLSKLTADTVSENKTSSILLEKLGFKKVGSHTFLDTLFYDYELKK